MERRKKTIRKQKILILSLLSVGVIGVSAAVATPFILNSNSDDSNNKRDIVNPSQQNSNKETFTNFIEREVFSLNANDNLNLTSKTTQDKILVAIKNKTKTILSSNEQNKIEILSKNGIIELDKVKLIRISIEFDIAFQKKKIWEFSLKFAINNGIKISNQKKVAAIKAKISDTNLTIDKDVDTSDDAKILDAIKAQLKIDNSTLSNSDLAKITDNISSLTPGVNTNVTLTITIESESDTISITINRPLSDAESVTKAKEAINSLSTKEITISATSGTITTNKVAILNGLKALDGYSALDLKGSTVTIKNSLTSLTLSGVSFTIVITKNSASTEISSGFTIKRSKTSEETNNDQIAAIKAKIRNTNLTIDKDVDTSDDAKILVAIKVQLQIDNSTLSNSDLAKITDNISSLTPGVNTNVTLTITISSQSDTIDITVNRPLNDIEEAKEAINSLSNKEVTISATSGTITTNKVAILSGLKALDGYSALDLKGSTITIKNSTTTLTPSGVLFTIVITKNGKNTEITSGFIVRRTRIVSELLNNLSITNGFTGKIFEDSQGNLWAMGSGSKLQVLAKDANSWTSSTSFGLTRGSNIKNCAHGTIFEDSKGNIWSIGNGNKLQVLKKGANSWTDSTSSGLTRGSNIITGSGTKIFEDSKGNLWSMGYKKPLQVLAKGASSWTSSTSSGLTRGSKITQGNSGTIFEDSKGNLWAMGSNSKLQVLKKGASSWTDNTSSGLTKNSNITNGQTGKIFEDSKGNIWSMGNGTPLQVLRKGAPQWTNSKTSGLTSSSNITDGSLGIIFEDSKDNLWTLSLWKKLQVLAKNTNSWTDSTSSGLTSSSNITNGRAGTIFEDSKGNLWSMAYGTGLQVLKKGASSWTSSTSSGLTRGSNITNGDEGSFFEDSNGNLWSMGKGTKIQVLINQKDGTYVNQWRN